MPSIISKKRQKIVGVTQDRIVLSQVAWRGPARSPFHSAETLAEPPTLLLTHFIAFSRTTWLSAACGMPGN